jgi:predicted Rossmann fold nucleotide-binding protein DprA/Smf involved in DNA uptake
MKEERMTLQKDLQAVNRELKKLITKTNKLISEVSEIESKKAELKTSKSTTKKAPAAKKASAQTDTEKVIKIIKGLKKGVGPKTLMKKTGFNEKKIYNILYRATKSGKIKKIDRGIYAGTS